MKIDKVCSTVWSQAHGLMFSKKRTLLFVFKEERCIAIHNWFVFFPITLLFINKQKEIVDITVLKPFSFYSSREKAKYLIETPYKINLSLNQKIEIKIKNKERRFTFSV